MDFSLLLIIFLNGIAHGALLFLVASGLNLVLGVLRILNLAHGSFYMLGAYLAFQYVFGFNNFWLALILAPLLVAGVGIVIERFLLRQIYRLEITYQLLFTFALGLIIADVVKTIWGSYKSVASPAILSKSILIFGQIYPLNNLFIIASAASILMVMWYFLNRTNLGWKVKATSYKGDIANALGINVPLLYTGVFGLGAFLSGLGGVMASLNRSITQYMDFIILAEAFAVVVIGGLGNFWGVFVAALLVGELNAFSIMFIPKMQGILLFGLMAAVLIFSPKGLFGWKATPFIRWENLKVTLRETLHRAPPLPSRYILFISLILVFLLVSGPFYLSEFHTIFLDELLIMALFALSYNLVLGYTGLLSFGHAAFFALGAYVCAITLLYIAPSIILGLLGAFAVGAGSGAIVGYLCKKTDEVYLSMLTLAFSQMVFAYLSKYMPMIAGVPRPPIHFMGAEIHIASSLRYYYFTLFIVMVAVLVLWKVVRSPFGLTLRAMRQNSSRVDFVGIPSGRYRLMAFTISGAFSGVAGALFAPFLRVAHHQFAFWTKSMEPILMSLLGGTQSFLGPALGAVIFTGLKELISGRFEVHWMIILGTLLILVILFFPGGIAEAIQRRLLFRRTVLQDR